MCEAIGEALSFPGCSPHATAFCHDTCSPDPGGAGDQCRRACFTTRTMCEDAGPDGEDCSAEPLPAHPERFPWYLEPSWWCYELHGEAGRASHCVKERSACEAAIMDLARKLGRTPDTLPGLRAPLVCARPDRDVYCSSQVMHGVVAYLCSLDSVLCEQASAQMAVAAGSPTSPCAVWVE
jgi:hypothetical protein